jgi:hypothetical protein
MRFFDAAVKGFGTMGLHSRSTSVSNHFFPAVRRWFLFSDPHLVGFSHHARPQARECRGHAPSHVTLPICHFGEAFASFEIVSGLVLDQTRRSTDLPSSKCLLICLYSKAGKKGVWIEVSLMLRELISVSACGNQCLISSC